MQELRQHQAVLAERLQEYQKHLPILPKDAPEMASLPMAQVVSQCWQPSSCRPHLQFSSALVPAVIAYVFFLKCCSLASIATWLILAYNSCSVINQANLTEARRKLGCLQAFYQAKYYTNDYAKTADALLSEEQWQISFVANELEVIEAELRGRQVS